MKKSAALLLFKRSDGELKVLLAHPGGPFWAKKDFGAWSVPKGEFTDEEDALTGARREFQEEMGSPVEGPFIPLSPIMQSNRKLVLAWAVEGDFDPDSLVSNEFEIEWPPRSGRRQRFPEVDRAAWFDLSEAKRRIRRDQWPIVQELVSTLGISLPD